MRLRAALLGLLLAPVPAAAQGSAAALDLLRSSLLAPDSPYAAAVSVSAGASRDGSKKLRVRFSPPNRWRREFLDAEGRPGQLALSDGRVEWFYDAGQRRAWRGEAPDPEEALRGPEEELELLERNYLLALAGEEAVAGRGCRVVELRSRAGKLLRRLWVDGERRLTLRSEQYREDGSLASAMRFESISFGPQEEPWFRFSPPPGTAVSESRLRQDYLYPAEAGELEGLKPAPPAWLPPGYALESVSVLPAPGARLLHYRYSDGVEALSLFQGPSSARFGRGGRAQALRLKPGGKARLILDGEERILEWRRGRQRFVLVGSLPVDVLRRVAESVAP